MFGGTYAGGMDEVEMDQLSVEESRDLLISALFVLKHLDLGKSPLIVFLLGMCVVEISEHLYALMDLLQPHSVY